jgi:hypothetical protein
VRPGGLGKAAQPPIAMCTMEAQRDAVWHYKRERGSNVILLTLTSFSREDTAMLVGVCSTTPGKLTGIAGRIEGNSASRGCELLDSARRREMTAPCPFFGPRFLRTMFLLHCSSESTQRLHGRPPPHLTCEGSCQT